MRNNIILALLLSAIGGMVQAQNYNVLLIPDSISKKADAVTRYEELHIIIKSNSKAIIQHKYAITIFNEDGDDYAEYSNSYNKMEDLSDISGNLYDAMGKKIKSVKKKDIEDVAVRDGMSLIRDDRTKSHNFNWKQYPYTIEYEDEQTYNSIFFLPYWLPFKNYYYGVQNSKFIVETPPNYNLRIKAIQYPGKPRIINDANGSTYTWEISNKPPVVYEPLSPSFFELFTNVFIAPTEFTYGNYQGNMSSWQSFGKFVIDLNKDRDALPENVRNDVHRIVNGLNTKEEKIKALYKYMQSNTRYINIVIGISGWQPFDAASVSTNKYGDCKALSNFMVSLLKEAGIKANYVLINSGKKVNDGLTDDFPAPYFNHAICCVPNGKDTIWLECTSQTESAGFMGSFTGNREALLIADDGGHVVRTPRYTSTENQQIRKVNATISETGDLSATVNTNFTGIKEELPHSLIHDASKELREKYLNNAINLPTYKVEKFDYTEHQDILPSADELLQISSSAYATVSGKRLFIQPNLFNKSNAKLSKDSARVNPIYIADAYKEIDSISITIPAGYTPEAIPANTSINNKFGSYSISYKVQGNKIELVRTEICDKNHFPATDYAELVKYYEAMYKADRNRIVFVKKDS